MNTEKLEYLKYQCPEEYERRMKLMAQGKENAQRNADKKKAFISARSRRNRRKEVTDQFGI